MFDLLIKNGLIVDGSGNPGFPGAIGVIGETVQILRGDTSEVESARVIDATERVVSPGFIDFHAHSALMLLAEPRHEPKVRQGVTTEVIGVDGNSYAPFASPADLAAFRELNAGLEGNPSLLARWSSVAEYLALFDKGTGVNVCYLIGNAPLRIAAVGWSNRPASVDELANMRALLREGMEEGAFGLSTGLDYPPGGYADTDELVALSQEGARLGGIYHSHVRYRLGDRILDPFREALEIGRRSGISAHVTHLYQPSSKRGSAPQLLGLVEDAYAGGLDVTFDTYTYALGSSKLLLLFPGWAQDGGPDRLKAVMRSKDGRARLRPDVLPSSPWSEVWLTNFNRAHNKQYEGHSVAGIAEMMSMDPVDAMCDLLLDEDLAVSYVGTSVNAATLAKFVAHPLAMIGSDALLIGDYPNPRTYGCFPLLLAEYVREEGYLSLPDAIRKMTSYPAQRLGIPDRGLLRNGFKADITIFHPREVRTPATRTQPKQFPIGIDYVIVNGKLVIDCGEHSGALPGRAIRRGRAST